jgi:FkbM family methyltransferase
MRASAGAHSGGAHSGGAGNGGGRSGVIVQAVLGLGLVAAILLLLTEPGSLTGTRGGAAPPAAAAPAAGPAGNAGGSALGRLSVAAAAQCPAPECPVCAAPPEEAEAEEPCPACPACVKVQPAAPVCPSPPPAPVCAACPAPPPAAAPAAAGGACSLPPIVADPGPFPPAPAWSRGPSGYPGVDQGARPGGFLAKMRDIGFHPTVIFDVGANRGDWAREAWAVYGGAAQWSAADPTLLLFEGFEEQREHLTATGFDFVISVVGETTRNVDFYASSRSHTGNSVLRENSQYFADVEPTRSVMRTLDELWVAYKAQHPATAGSLPGPQLLKLDVQGYEINVLRGAAEVLKSVEIITLETSVLNYNAGTPLVGQVLGFMDGLGFQVIDLIEQHHGGPDGAQLIQIDFGFIRKGHPLIQPLNARAGITDGRRR